MPRPRAWRIDALRELLPRRYLLRRVALELFLAGGASHFVCFHDRDTRRRVHQRIIALRPAQLSAASFNVHFGRDQNSLETRHQQLLDDWQCWRISNFDYLMRLNTLAGRSFNDLTQYPVVPWVLRDYTSASLDLDERDTYRDFSKPIGAQLPTQAARFQQRFDEYEDAGMGAKPFHYGSHYSSSGIVLFYLIRLEPFASEAIQMQGGRFDVADRLFDNMADTWKTCLTNMSDVKELIPEFFTTPDFLRNANGLQLGTMQSGRRVDDVALPPWASSPEEFVRLHREALESDFVSAQLHQWIDLVFGYQQRGQPAIDATNVFYYLTYEGAVDLDRLDPDMRAAVEAQIMFFGQTPAQLLTRPHPKRRARSTVGVPRQMFERPEAVKAHGPYSVGGRKANGAGGSAGGAGVDPLEFIHPVPLEDRLLTITRSGRLQLHKWFPLKPNGNGKPFTFTPASAPLLTLPEAAHAARQPPHGAQPSYAVSSDGKWLLSGGHWDTALRCTSLAAPDVCVHSYQHSAVVTCITVGADGATIVTGSADSTLVVWSLYGGVGVPALAGAPTGALAAPRALHVLCGHRGRVACAAVSTQMDLVLSGATPEHIAGRNGGRGDGWASGRRACAVWSACDGQFVRWLDVGGEPRAVAISHTGSGLLVCTAAGGGAILELFSVNGRPLTRVALDAPLGQLVCTRDGENIVASEGAAVTVRRLHDLGLLHSYPEPQHAVSALALCAENHHAFVGTEDGGMRILANPIVNIQVLEAIAGELLNL